MSIERLHLFVVISLWFGGVPSSSAANEPHPTKGRPNVLMILVDDLKPTLGCYGDPIAKAPQIDALASRGMKFDLAYCNQAVCTPDALSLA